MRAARLAAALCVLAGCSYEWDRYEPRANGTDAAAPEDLVVVDAEGMDATLDVPDSPRSCRASNDCASNELGLRVCDTSSGRCVQCTPGEDICSPTQYCVAATNTCQLGCRSDEACLSLAGDAGVSDAGINLPRRCEMSSRRCVACVTDEHCPIGTRCMGNACVPGCDSSRGCPEGSTCCGGGCIDAQTDPQHCGNCGTVCSTVNGVPACMAGRCAVGSCNTPFADCDSTPGNGCETDTQTSLAHCGMCGRSCAAPPNATAACTGGVCGLGTCNPGFGDCDGDVMNGCETALNTSLAHCGACGRVCQVPNGLAQCVQGSCQRSGCTTGFADCDGDTGNGCEVNLTNDPQHCRSCNAACSLPRATAVCVSSACAVGTCEAGFDNCDGMAANGCEANLTTSTSHCGACGRSCAFPRATPSCEAGTCAIDRCNTGFGNCDGNLTNGCETDNLTAVAHCGACNNACPAPANATAQCRAGACGFTCNAGFADCDRLPGNGCEVNLNTSTANCGGCGVACSLGNADAVCTAGTCQVQRCRAGYGDCDNNPTNGCETSTTASAQHCGVCGNACAGPNSSQTCIGGACQVTACTGSFSNCDNVSSNGCETDLSTSATSCGACGVTCAAGRTCTVGRCATSSFAGYSVTALTPVDIPFVDACALPGAQRLLPNVDDDFESGTIPFDVEYWGATTRDYLVNSNGVLGIGNLYFNINAIPERTPYRAWPTLPTTTGIVPGIYAYGVDLVTGPGGVCIATTGTSPNRRWIAEWDRAQYYLSTTGSLSPTSVTFEVILYESSRNVDIAYGPTLLGPITTIRSPDHITVGIQDFRPSPVRATPYTGDVTSNTRLRFTPL